MYFSAEANNSEAYKKAGEEALRKHLVSINSDSGVSTQDEPDLSYWINMGIHTVAQYEHAMAAADYVDSVKERYGCKPRWVDLSQYSAQQLSRMALEMSGYRSEEDIRREAEEESQMIDAALGEYIPNNPFASLKSSMAA